MFVNSNYSAKLAPTMKENWLVQIFKNTNSSILYTNTPDLRFCFAADSGSTTATYNSLDYIPAILNKPSVSYSLDLKGFTTKTGSVTLNIANVDIDGTKLLEQLGNTYINGQVNILSVIDDDSTAANALQIFSGRISSFAYRNNVIVISLISNRPFQNVSIPTTKTSNSTIEQYNNKVIPLVYGDYTANSGFTNGTDVYACPFLKNDGKNFMYIVPENTSGTDKLEFYDKGMKRFLELTGTDTTIATEDSAKVLKVPKLMRRQFKMLPDEIDGGVVEQEGSSAGSIAVTGDIANCFDGSTSTEVDINHSGNFADIRGVTMKLVMPQVSGKITAITLGLDGTITQAYSSGSPGSGDGLFVNLATSLSSNFGSTSGDVEIIGSSSSYNRTTSIDLTASYSAVNIASVLVDGALPDDLYLSFRWDTADGNVDCNSWNISLENVYVTVTADNDNANEPIASSDFNAGIDKVYLGRDITSNTFTGHSATQDALNNPVSIHRQLLKSVLDYDLADDTDNVDSGYKSVADLRDSDSTHWKTRLELQDTESIESVLQQLQYEGCFFFEFSPQAQQTAITGVSSLRYFTIANGTPTADKSLSEVDISDYEIGITEVGDLETSLVVNYKKHPAENEYLQQKTYVSAVSGSVHSTIFDNAAHQKQELNLDMLYSAVDGAGGDRNSDWINFRSALFGQYKTTMSATIINPEKYGMLQVGDFLDFGDTLFGNLGTPFSEISDTFDDMVAMPTRLFSEQWSDKRFIITNLKRQIGKVSVQCREV
tara:strand:- start:2517 stop:4826 length:2310 start_codon:yes stop_codon:yes gene_type:complete